MTIQIFVYGTLRSGGSHWSRLLSPLEGEQAMTEPQYIMRSHGHFPSVHRGGVTAIRGEVLSVNAEQLITLDQLEGHPHCYCREQVPVTLHNGQNVVAWIYLMPPGSHLDAEIIASGDWTDHPSSGE